MTPEFIDALKELGVDAEVTMERFMGNEDLYLRCLSKFITDPNYDKLLISIENNDDREAFEASHALKGVSANLGFDKLFKELVPIVEVFRAGRMDFDPDNLERIKSCYNDATTAIKQLV